MNVSDFFDPPSAVEQMPDVMIDTETMGTRPDAPVIALGAVSFDLRNLTMGERFYRVIDLKSSVDLGSRIDPGTVLWWMEQSDDARKALLRKGENVSRVLLDFAQWLDIHAVEKKARTIWACGTDFDCVLLSEHYIKAGIETPWMYWGKACYRTIRDRYPNVEPEPRTGLHNALDDAVFQTEHLFKIRRTLRGQA